jgi:hypothetical protein
LWHGLKPEKMVWAIGLFAMVLMLKIIKVCRCVAGCLVDAFESLFAYLFRCFYFVGFPLGVAKCRCRCETPAWYVPGRLVHKIFAPTQNVHDDFSIGRPR